MIGTMLILAQAATTAPATPPADRPRTVVEDIVIEEGKAGSIVRLPEGKNGERKRVIIVRDGATATSAGTGDKREVRIVHRGHGGDVRTLVSGCEDGSRFETEAEGVKDGKPVRTRILLCDKGQPGGVTQLEALERAAKRMAENTDLPEDVRTKVVASLNAEISRLKAAK